MGSVHISCVSGARAAVNLKKIALAEIVILSSALSEGSEGLQKNEGFIDMGPPHRGHGCHVQG